MTGDFIIEEIRITVPCETDFLTVIRRLATETAWRAGFTILEAGEIELAVDEVATAVIVSEPAHGLLSVVAQVTERALEITLGAAANRTFDRDVVLACMDELDAADASTGVADGLRLRRFRNPGVRPRPVSS
jgi:hypothetical protein